MKEVAGFNIRIAREWRDVGKGVLPKLLDPRTGTIQHTLIVSPPCQGKTTMIRDLARLLSSGLHRSYKVGVVDERSEIAACVRGVPKFDLGPRTDVLDGCPKAEGMMMMIRSLSPEVLIVDEIGRPEDADAVLEALHAGIVVIATAHGRDVEELQRHPMLKKMLQAGVFQRIVLLSRLGTGPRVYDAQGKPIGEKLPC